MEEILCICFNNVDDSLTIQCEQCLIWQHAACVGIDENYIPEHFLCAGCSKKKKRGRPPKKPKYQEIQSNIRSAACCNAEIERGFDLLELESLPSANIMMNKKNGLFVDKKLEPTNFICEYVGMMYTKEEYTGDGKFTLTFAQFIVDSKKYGNLSRFVKKGCRPNAETKGILIDKTLLSIGIFSRSHMSSGEEVILPLDQYSSCDCGDPDFCLADTMPLPTKVTTTKFEMEDYIKLHRNTLGKLLDKPSILKKLPQSPVKKSPIPSPPKDLKQVAKSTVDVVPTKRLSLNDYLKKKKELKKE